MQLIYIATKIAILQPNIGVTTGPTCLVAKPTNVKYDVSDDDECESDDCRSDDDDEEYTKEELMDML